MRTAKGIVQSVSGAFRFSLFLKKSSVYARCRNITISSLAAAGHALVVGNISHLTVALLGFWRPVFVAMRLGFVDLERLFTLHLGQPPIGDSV
jgi:hypothetical protein